MSKNAFLIQPLEPTTHAYFVAMAVPAILVVSNGFVAAFNLLG